MRAPKAEGLALKAKAAAVLLVPAMLAAAGAYAETVDFGGYLYDEGAEARFDVYAEVAELDVTFTYPAAAAFRVRVLGQTGQELGDFPLAGGPVIKLSGGGKFTLIVYSESGGGPWTAFYER
jgi:hypothetical protein